MASKVIDGFKTTIKLKTRYPVLKFDTLKMYFGEPYVIDLPSADGKVTVKVPSIEDVAIKIGEEKFFATLNVLTTNTTQYRLILSKADPPIDWNEISDFELFTKLYSQLDPEVIECLFDIDFRKFGIFNKNVEGKDPELIMYDKEDEIEINEEVYQHFAQYLRLMFSIKIEEKITRDPILKAMYLQKDEFALKRVEKKKGEETSSMLLALISACVNHPGFKYRLSELKQVNICEFYDSVSRLRIYENTVALLRGSYSGMVDTSKINKDEFDFMRRII